MCLSGWTCASADIYLSEGEEQMPEWMWGSYTWPCALMFVKSWCGGTRCFLTFRWPLIMFPPFLVRLPIPGSCPAQHPRAHPLLGPLLLHAFRRTQMAGARNRKHLAMKQQFTPQSLRIHLNNARSDGLRVLNAAFNVQSCRNYHAVWSSSRPLIVKCCWEFSHSGWGNHLF